MKLIKEYLCDDGTPSDEELKECLEIIDKDDCAIKLTWFFHGWHWIFIKKGMNLEECKDKLPKRYSV